MATPAQKRLVQERHAHIRGANNTQSKRYKRTGFSGKTLWDWIQLFVQVIGAFVIPLSLIALLLNVQQFNTQQNNTQKMTIEQQKYDLARSIDQQQQTTLGTYLDRMSDLLLTAKLRESKPGDASRQLARARTLAALKNLDPFRKGILLQFLYESGLIYSGWSDYAAGAPPLTNPIVDLWRADLSNANLAGADLAGVDLFYVDLSGADLEGAVIADGAILTDANLTNALQLHF